MLYDDSKREPGIFLEDLCVYLGVERGFQPRSVHVRVMYPELQRLLLRSGLSWSIGLGKASLLGARLRSRHARRGRPIATQRDRCELAEVFAEDVTELACMLGRDLSQWLVQPVGKG